MFITATAIKGLISTCAGLGFIGVVGIAIAKPEWLGIPQYSKNYVLIMQDTTVKGVATVFNSEQLEKLTNYKCSVSKEPSKEDADCSIDKVQVDLSKRWVDLKTLATKTALTTNNSDEKVDFFYRLKIKADLVSAITWTDSTAIEILDKTPPESATEAVSKSAFLFTTDGGEQSNPPTNSAPDASSDLTSTTKTPKHKVLATITPQFSIEGKANKNNGYFGYIAKAKSFTKVVPATPVTGGSGDTVNTKTTDEEITKLVTKKHYFKCSESAPTTTTTTTTGGGTAKKSTSSEPDTSSTNPQCWISDFTKPQVETTDSDYKQHNFYFSKYYSSTINKNHLYVIRYPHQDTRKLDQTSLHLQVLDTSTRKPTTEGVASIEFENLFPVFIYPFGTNALAFDLKTSS